MLERIYLWDIKHGTPEKPTSTESVSTESINAFVKALEEKPKETNANLQGFAQFFGQFLQEASEFYPDDDAVMQNKDIAFRVGNGDTDVVLYIDEIPRDSYEYFYTVLNHAASLYQLVQWDPISNSLTLPSDPKKTAYNYHLWQQQLITLKAPPNTEQEALPETATQVKRLAVKILKDYLPKVGIKNAKVTSGETAEVTIHIDKVRVVLENFFEVDTIYKYESNKVRVNYTPAIYIFGYGAQLFRISYPHFMKIPFTNSASVELETNTVTELKQNLAEGVKMLAYLYPHMQSDESLYHFLSNAPQDKQLSRHYFSTLRHISQSGLYLLAHELNQPNLTELHNTLKQAYIDDHMFYLQEDKKKHEAREARRVAENPEYVGYDYFMPENPEAEYAQDFDKYVNKYVKSE